MQYEDALPLADYRRQVHATYAAVRRSSDPEVAWSAWRAARDRLFRSHPQSAIDVKDRERFSGLRYFDYDPSMRFEAPLSRSQGQPTLIGHSGAGETRFVPIGSISLASVASSDSLTVYWLDTYGGGLFLPFRDSTSGDTTYGGGRYLLDTAKGADLGGSNAQLVVDFNFSYHPSCVYSPRWSCPLAPRENWLSRAIEAGEMLDNG